MLPLEFIRRRIYLRASCNYAFPDELFYTFSLCIFDLIEGKALTHHLIYSRQLVTYDH